MKTCCYPHDQLRAVDVDGTDGVNSSAIAKHGADVGMDGGAAAENEWLTG